MHCLEVIIAMNNPEQAERRTPEELAAYREAKRENRARFFEHRGLAAEIDLVIQVFGSVPACELRAKERLLLRLAREAKAAGIDGPAELTGR